MLIPINWLKEYINTKLDEQAIANTLTLAGLTIEEVENGVLNGEVTANRPDWLSIYGVARELSALTDTPLREIPKVNLPVADQEDIKIEISDQTLIERYTGYVIKDIKIADSPDWLKQRLSSVGIRSINNVVDITNYIMIAYGLPLHSFDIDKITGPIVIRRGNQKEKIRTLDQIERTVNSDIIVAENKGKLIDLVGIMGGALSDTTSKTKNIFLQGAVFPAQLIRKSSKKIKLSTEASYRYERGVDFTSNDQYLDQAAKLVLELCGGNITQKIDINTPKTTNKPIQWSPDKAEKLLGIHLSSENSVAWLNRLGIKTHQHDENYASTSPTWRFDINLPEDIYEEIARIYPVNDFPRTQLPPITKPEKTSDYYKIEFIKDQLVDLGFTETDGYSFLSDKNLKDAKLNNQNCLEASNPLSEEYQYLRPSLLPDMLMSIAQNPLYNPIALFEIGNTFNQQSETTKIGIALAGSKNQIDLLKNALQDWLEKFGLKFPLDKISNDILVNYKIRKPEVYFIEIDFSTIIKFLKKNQYNLTTPIMDQHYISVSKYPAVKRDLAIIVDKNINSDQIITTINILVKQIEVFVELFDEFTSDKFGENKKSLAFHLVYQANDKTLTDQEVDQLHAQVIEKLKKDFQAIPRIT